MKDRNLALIVDDSELNRSMLADILSDEYDIIEAENGLEAISQFEKHQFDISLVLLDIVMPEMDGFEVLAIMSKNKWIERVPVIIISAESSSSYIDNAYDLGATEFISRPFDPKTVQRRASNTVMLYSKQNMLENMVTEQMLDKEKSNLIMVELLSHIVEFRNGESGMHVLNIRSITKMLLTQLCRTSDRYASIRSKISLIANASSLHDIGKISVPEHILNNPGSLSADEWVVMKAHSMAGANILESTRYYPDEELVRVARDICRWHHERYDGGGYPDALVGEQIPIEAGGCAGGRVRRLDPQAGVQRSHLARRIDAHDPLRRMRGVQSAAFAVLGGHRPSAEERNGYEIARPHHEGGHARHHAQHDANRRRLQPNAGPFGTRANKIPVLRPFVSGNSVRIQRENRPIDAVRMGCGNVGAVQHRPEPARARAPSPDHHAGRFAQLARPHPFRDPRQPQRELELPAPRQQPKALA